MIRAIESVTDQEKDVRPVCVTGSRVLLEQISHFNNFTNKGHVL